MMKRNLFAIILCLFTSLLTNAQNIIKSCVINIEKDKVYLDITAPTVKIGDVLSIREESGYILHPVTNIKIKKEGAIIADLEIVEIQSEYSVATIFPEEAINKIKVGMIAEMPELPDVPSEQIETEDKKENNITDNSPQQNVPITADGIIKKYLKATRLEKFVNEKSLPTFWKKTQVNVITEKGKQRFGSMYIAYDVSSKKMYLKYDSPENDNAWHVFSKVIAVNGEEGWFRFKRGRTVKLKKKFISNIWNNRENDTFGLSLFNREIWNRKYLRDDNIEGKECFVIKYSSRNNSDLEIVVYYDKLSGLEIYSESTTAEVKTQAYFMEYKQFGDLLLCSKSRIKYSGKGEISEETTTLEDICIDCQLDNSLFTKDAVKNAF